MPRNMLYEGGNPARDRRIEIRGKIMGKLLLPYTARRLIEAFRKHRTKPVYVMQDGYDTITVIGFDLPGAKRDIAYIIYTSGQVTRPLSPKQVASKIRRLKKWLRRITAPSDKAVAIICPAGYTPGAKALLRRNGILVFDNPDDFLRFVAEYFSRRYTRLIEAVRGKRLFGELKILAAVLHLILQKLAPNNIPPGDPIRRLLQRLPSPIALADPEPIPIPQDPWAG